MPSETLGKTTTIGKPAYQLKKQGLNVVLGAVMSLQALKSFLAEVLNLFHK